MGNNPVNKIDPDGNKIKPWGTKYFECNEETGRVTNGFVNKDARLDFTYKFWNLLNNDKSSIFAKVVERLTFSAHTYQIIQQTGWLIGIEGRYIGSTRSIELFSRTLYDDAIFEEFFHAAQHDFYGNKNDNRIFANEFEVRVAKIIWTYQTGNEDMSNEDVLNRMSSSDKSIIAKGMLGEKVDKKLLANAFKNLTEAVRKTDSYNKHYKENFDYNKSLDFLKSIIKASNEK
jgi:hypothetical protein